MPIFLECRRCAACCRWPGQVQLTGAEIRRLAAFKALSEHKFIQQFTRLRSDRRGLVLMDRPNGECVFLEGDNCSVQPVKPQQCLDFPNLWSFPGVEKSCRAIPREVSEEEWCQLIREATVNDAIRHNVGPDPGPNPENQAARLGPCLRFRLPGRRAGN